MGKVSLQGGPTDKPHPSPVSRMPLCIDHMSCQGGALGPDSKRQRVTADAETARKDSSRGDST